MKVYFYDLEPRVEPASGFDPKTFDLLNQTYAYVLAVLRRFETHEPSEADFFLVPLNLIKWQFANRDPDVLDELAFLTERPDHLLVALGDYSQRDERNRFGGAYRTTYSWISRFALLALEATGDLLRRDVALVPANTLEREPHFNENERRYLWSFLGGLNNPHLPPPHVRGRMKQLPVPRDALVASALSPRLARRLRKTYSAADPHELVARHSTFTLCPAGFGRWTYRFFHAIRWGSIPVLISDDYTPPFAWEIPYGLFSLRLPEARLESVDGLLRGLSPDRIQELQHQLRLAQSHFTPHAFERYLSRALEHLRDSGYRSAVPSDAQLSLPGDLLAENAGASV